MSLRKNLNFNSSYCEFDFILSERLFLRHFFGIHEGNGSLIELVHVTMMQIASNSYSPGWSHSVWRIQDGDFALRKSQELELRSNPITQLFLC